MIALRTLELTRPIEVPADLGDREAVRFYCTVHGAFVGYVTIWIKGRPLGRSQLIEELCRQLGQPLLSRFFRERFDGETEPWANLQRLLRVQLKAEQPEMELFSPEEELKLPELTASITIPSRDRPEDIRRCLESLTTHQSRIPFEIVVADNNPSSGLTEPVVRSFPGVVYIPEPRPGVTFARNAAALHARGDVIVCTDDDVTFMPGWLDNLMAPYADPEVMAVTGLVLPYELEHAAQYWFEVYGGLTRDFKRIRYDKAYWIDPNGQPMVPTWEIGVTANASFRAEIFSDPAIGPFDDQLRIAEDPYLLYRIVKNNRVVIYEPRAVVQHRHRQSMDGLARQLYNYARSYTGMELRTYFRDGDPRGLRCTAYVAKYDRDRIFQKLKNKRGLTGLFFRLALRNWQPDSTGPLHNHPDYPMQLLIAEAKGHVVGPFSLAKSIFQVHTRLGQYTAEQFAIAQAARQREKLLAQARREDEQNLIEQEPEQNLIEQEAGQSERKQLAEPDSDRALAQTEVIVSLVAEPEKEILHN